MSTRMPTAVQAALLSVFAWVFALATFFVWKVADVLVTAGDQGEHEGLDVRSWLWLVPLVGAVSQAVSMYRLARQGTKNGMLDVNASPLVVALCCLLGSGSLWIFDAMQTEGAYHRGEGGVPILGTALAIFLLTWAGLSIRRRRRRAVG